MIRISATAASFKPAMILAFLFGLPVIAAVTVHNSAEVVQDVFYELVEACRLMMPLEQIGAWLFRVARNRIMDLSEFCSDTSRSVYGG